MSPLLSRLIHHSRTHSSEPETSIHRRQDGYPRQLKSGDKGDALEGGSRTERRNGHGQQFSASEQLLRRRLRPNGLNSLRSSVKRRTTYRIRHESLKGRNFYPWCQLRDWGSGGRFLPDGSTVPARMAGAPEVRPEKNERISYSWSVP